MKTSIDIVYLGTNAVDADLINDTLVSAEIACRITPLSPVVDYDAALNLGAPDIILANPRDTGFSVIEIAQWARRLYPAVPVIVVTAPVGEDAAIELLTLGVADIVRANTLERLAPAVRRAMAFTTDRNEKQRLADASQNSKTRIAGRLSRLSEAVELDQLTTTLLSQFAGVTTSEIDDQICASIEAIGGAIGADYVFIVMIDWQKATWGIAYDWATDGTPGMKDVFQNVAQGAPQTQWFEQKILAGEVIRLNSPDDIPAEAAAFRDIMSLYQYKSLLEVPLQGRGRSLKGSIGFATHARQVAWQQADINRLLLMSDAIANALERKQAEEALILQSRFDEMMTRIMASFATCTPEQADATIVNALRDYANRAGVEHAFVNLADLGGDTWSVSHEWHAPSAPSFMTAQHVPFGARPWTENHVRERTIIRLNNAADYPPEAVQERATAALDGVRSVLIVPMGGSSTRILGSVVLRTYTHAMSWSDREVTHLHTVADAIANLIERARAQERVKQQLETLTALYTGAQKLADNLDSQKLAEYVVQACTEVFGAQAAWIGRLEPDLRLNVLAISPPGLRHPRQSMFNPENAMLNHGVISDAVLTGAPVIINDMRADPKYTDIGGIIEELGLVASAVLPLVSRQHSFGVLMLLAPAPGFFNTERVAFLQSYTHMVAAALENARLYEVSERSLSSLQSLHTVDMALTSNLDLSTTLNVILDQVVQQLKVDATDILLLMPNSTLLAYAAGRGFRSRNVQKAQLMLGEGYAGQAALQRHRVTYSDEVAAHGSSSDERYISLMHVEGFVEHLAIPLIAKGQVKGVLEIYLRAPLNADSGWMEFLDMLVGQVAVAVDNAGLYNDLQRSNTELMLAYEATIEGLSKALDLRDKETEGHTQRVAEMTIRLARSMGLDESAIVHVRRGALLHDIGKMGIRDNILLKPGPLNEEEWKVMRQHPGLAYEMLAPISFLHNALDIPYCHHERWDGTGYPRGLKDVQIPLAARIFSVVDAWDALRTDRPYRQAWTSAQVISYIRQESGVRFDPRVVQCFTDLLTIDL